MSDPSVPVSDKDTQKFAALTVLLVMFLTCMDHSQPPATASQSGLGALTTLKLPMFATGCPNGAVVGSAGTGVVATGTRCPCGPC